MCEAAEEVGLDAIGFADHCNVSSRERQQRAKHALGFNLDITYERRREAIKGMRERFDIDVYDGVEMDFDSRDIDEISAFLDEAGFQYAIGSVHHLEAVNVHVEPYFARKSEGERADLVDQFFGEVVALLESELFDIAAHVDLVERNPALRGFATDDHYHAVAEAAEQSRTLLELNAGRVLGEYGELHPNRAFLEVLADYDIEFVLGTDSHEPGEIGERKEEIEKFVTAHGLETVELGL
ncbi:MAG: histidinol-phosphatase (PHP family) [Natronomonas sp.]|jgi:histidinol-phosphatase (PHP family)